jgi:glycosyltransferase involved in cell wall biosynthesis
VSPGEPLASIGLPVRNGEQYIRKAVESVLGQSHADLELVISDNASVDDTEQICRQYARADRRVRYHRQPENIGLVENFNAVLDRARGTYFKWLGHDDWLTPAYVTRCVEVLEADESLIVVTTQQAHVGPDGTVETAGYDGTRLQSDRAVERFVEMLRLQNESPLLLDPLYGMMRREAIARLPRPIMLFEDQVLAARLALAGPFGHVPEVLSYRRGKPVIRLSDTADRLGVPRWQTKVGKGIQCRELVTAAREADLEPHDRRRAHAAIARLFVESQRVDAARRSRKLAGMAARALPGRRQLSSVAGR